MRINKYQRGLPEKKVSNLWASGLPGRWTNGASERVCFLSYRFLDEVASVAHSNVGSASMLHGIGTIELESCFEEVIVNSILKHIWQHM